MEPCPLLKPVFLSPGRLSRSGKTGFIHERVGSERAEGSAVTTMASVTLVSIRKAQAEGHHGMEDGVKEGEQKPRARKEHVQKERKQTTHSSKQRRGHGQGRGSTLVGRNVRMQTLTMGDWI